MLHNRKLRHEPPWHIWQGTLNPRWHYRPHNNYSYDRILSFEHDALILDPHVFTFRCGPGPVGVTRWFYKCYAASTIATRRGKEARWLLSLWLVTAIDVRNEESEIMSIHPPLFLFRHNHHYNHRYSTVRGWTWQRRIVIVIVFHVIVVRILLLFLVLIVLFLTAPRRRSLFANHKTWQVLARARAVIVFLSTIQLYLQWQCFLFPMVWYW